MHSLIAVIGAIVAAVGGGVLLARCFRTPRGDLIAWSVGLLGLLVSLGAQAMGYVSGFDGTIFRAMELGGQVIAPMAFVLALWEVAGKSPAARFCARLYIPALGLVALVVLALDQLTTATFSKTFPAPSVFYQAPPNYVLTYAIGPITALLAVIAAVTVMARSSQPSWNEVLPGVLAGAVAALCLAYPGLAQFVSDHVHALKHLPQGGSTFGGLCTLAAIMALLAGLKTSQLSLAALRGQTAADGKWAAEGSYTERAAGSRRGGADGYGPADTQRRANGRGRADGYTGAGGYDDYGDSAYGDPAGRGKVQLDGGLYRPGRPGQDPARDRRDDRWDDDRAGGAYPDFATGDFLPGDVASGFDQASDWQSGQQGAGRPGGPSGYNGDAPARRGRGGPGRPEGEDSAEQRRAELFGQITIYTLAEERVDEFDKLTERIVELVRSREPDTLVFIAHAVPSAATQRILYQVYRSRAAYQRHLAQPYIQQFDADRRPYVLATNVIELGLQQAKVSPFPSVTDLFPEPGYDTSGFERPDYLRDYGRKSPEPGGRERERR